MANRANSSDLKIRWPTNVVSTFCRRQGSVNVNPETFDMAFERNIMTANSQMAILWHTDPPTTRALVLSSCRFSHPTSNRINTLHDVVNESQIELIICEVECRQEICDDFTFFAKWCQIVAGYTKLRVLGPRQNPEEPRNGASFVKRPDRWRSQTGIYQTNMTKTSQKPCQIGQTCHASVQGECCGPTPTYRTRLSNRVRSEWIPGFRQHYQEGSSKRLE